MCEVPKKCAFVKVRTLGPLPLNLDADPNPFSVSLSCHFQSQCSQTRFGYITMELENFPLLLWKVSSQVQSCSNEIDSCCRRRRRIQTQFVDFCGKISCRRVRLLVLMMVPDAESKRRPKNVYCGLSGKTLRQEFKLYEEEDHSLDEETTCSSSCSFIYMDEGYSCDIMYDEDA